MTSQMSQQAHGKSTASAHFRTILEEGETDLRHYIRLINNCHEDEPLLSETPLGHRLAAVPLDSLGPAELGHLQLALNVEQLIPTASGLPRDYRGLAELMGFSSLELESRFKRSHNPSKSLLDAYVLQSRLRGQQARRSLNQLLKLLESIERFDIIDDLLPQLVNWATQVQHVHGLGHGVVVEPVLGTSQQLDRINRSESRSQQQARQLYDAFVCFAPEDFRYAQQLIGLLEANNRRLVTVDNLLPGRFEYDAIVQMIATECRKVIVILTPNYLLSKDCDFQTKFANELAIKSGWNPRLIPVLCEPLDDAQLPYLLRFMSKIDMTPRLGNQPAWQLKKLLFALDHDNNQPAGGELASGQVASLASCVSYAAPPGVQQRPLDTASGGLTPSGQESRMPPEHSLAIYENRNTAQYYDSQSSRGPIIDLAYSQTGTTTSTATLTINSGLSLMTSGSTRVFTPSGCTSASGNSHAPVLDGNQTGPATPSMNPFNWYRSFKRRVRSGFRSTSECGASSPERGSLSSRAILLPSGDSEENLTPPPPPQSGKQASDHEREHGSSQ